MSDERERGVARNADEPTDKELLHAQHNDPNKYPPGPVPAVIDELSPDTAAIGDPDFVLFVSGGPFTAASVIVFAGHDEPTTLNDDGTLSTGVNMSLWLGPDTVQVQVRNGPELSNALDFTFGAVAGRGVDDDDDSDDNYETEEEADGDSEFEETHPAAHRAAKKKRRKR